MCNLKQKGKLLDTAPDSLKRLKTCVISVTGQNASSKRFFCSWVAIRFVRNTHSCGPHEGECVCVFWFCVRRGVVPDVCSLLQVESLIENEAEKDYLYDVLRMYHQWVALLYSLLIHTVCIYCVCHCLHFYKELESCSHFYICACWFLTPSTFVALSRILIACHLYEWMGRGGGGGLQGQAPCFNESFYMLVKPLISFHCAPTSLASYPQKPFFMISLQTELNWHWWIIQSGGPMDRFHTIAEAALR